MSHGGNRNSNDRQEYPRRAAAPGVAEDSPAAEEEQNKTDKGDERQVRIAIVAPRQRDESRQGLSEQQQGGKTEGQKPEMVGGQPFRILVNGSGYCGGC